MDRFVERAVELRAITERHYNCAQSVLVPFAEALGMDEETLYRTAANFGGGMKMASVCGTLTGCLMALGLAGMDDVPTLQRIYRDMKARHEGYLDCANLLRLNAAKGLERKPHCDAMVYEMVRVTEEILREKGLLPDAEKAPGA